MVTSRAAGVNAPGYNGGCDNPPRKEIADSPGLTNSSCSTTRPPFNRKRQRGQGSYSNDFDPGRAIGMDHIRRVALRGEGEASVRRLHVGVEPIHQHDASGRRRGRGEQERVIAPGANAGDGPAGEPAQAVRFDPLCVGINRCRRERRVAGGGDPGCSSVWLRPGQPGSAPPATTAPPGYNDLNWIHGVNVNRSGTAK